MSVATVYWRWLVLAAPLPDDSPRIARDGDDRLRSSPLTPLCRERSIFAQIFRDRQAPMPRVDRTQRKLGWACNWRIAPARSRRRHPYTSSVQQPQRAGPCITIGARTPEADVTKRASRRGACALGTHKRGCRWPLPSSFVRDLGARSALGVSLRRAAQSTSPLKSSSGRVAD